MRATINQSTVSIYGKLSESEKIERTVLAMMKEFNTMCIIESFGIDGFGSSDGYDMCEITLCYDSDEATVKTVKESYSENKKAA